MDGWLSLISTADSGRIECVSCKQSNQISQLHFRKRACYTPLAIQIQPVFESEAVPDAGLLAALALAFGSEIKYAYT